MIIINGVNYYNHEIESVVETIPQISISYTATCGVIDANQQEQIAIFFHTEVNNQDQLRELINAKSVKLFLKR